MGVSELEELFPVTRSTTYRAIARAGGRIAGSDAAAWAAPDGATLRLVPVPSTSRAVVRTYVYTSVLPW